MSKKRYAHEILPGDSFHPGEFIKDELEARKMKQQELADAMGTSKSIVSQIINGKRNITLLLATKIEKALDIDAQLWMRLQVRYELDMIRIKQGDALKKPAINDKKMNNLKETLPYV